MKKEIELPKGATIEIKKNKIVIEYEETFAPKNGDFCVIDETPISGKVLFISDGRRAGPNRLSYHVAQNHYGVSLRPTLGLPNRARPVTDEERKELLSELHKIGKDWDAKKMELVDFKWVPKEGETVYYASAAAKEKVYEAKYSGFAYDKRLLERGLMFRTRAEAVACAERMLEAVKTK
jgi:hypothetical protein